MKQFVSVVLQTTRKSGSRNSDSPARPIRSPGCAYRDKRCLWMRHGRLADGAVLLPLDGKIYVDLAFYDDLKRRFNAPGDFARPM